MFIAYSFFILVKNIIINTCIIYVSMYMIYKNIELNEYNIHYYKTLADNIKNEYNKQLAYNKDILQNELNKKIYV